MASETKLIAFYKGHLKFFRNFQVLVFGNIVIYSMVFNATFLYPFNDILYYEYNFLNISIFILEAVSFMICCSIIASSTEKKFSPSSNSVVDGFILYLCIAVFGFIHSPLCIFISKYGQGWYHSSQSVIHRFVNNHNDKTDMNLRLIAIHHYMSTFIIDTKNCYKSWNYTLRKMNETCDTYTYLNELYSAQTVFDPEEVLKSICRKRKLSDWIVVIMGWLTVILSNISLTRLLLWDGINIAMQQSCLFFGKWLLEIAVIMILLLWVQCNEKAGIVFERLNGPLLRQFNDYYGMILNSHLSQNQLNKIGYKFEDELRRWYEKWKDRYERQIVKDLLNGKFGDIGCMTFLYVYDDEIIQNIDIKFNLGRE